MHFFQVEIGKDQKPTGDTLAAVGVSLLTISSSLAGDVGPPSGRLANRVGQAASGQGALKPRFPDLYCDEIPKLLAGSAEAVYHQAYCAGLADAFGGMFGWMIS